MKLCLGKPLLLSKNLHEPFKVIVFFSQMRTCWCQGVMSWKTTQWQLVLALALVREQGLLGRRAHDFLTSCFPSLSNLSSLRLPPPFFLSFMHSVQALVETDLSTYFNLPLSCVVGEYCVTMVLNLTESQLSHLWNGDNTSITPFLPPKRLCLCLSCPILPSTALATQGGRQNPHIQKWDSNDPVNNGHPDHLNN